MEEIIKEIIDRNFGYYIHDDIVSKITKEIIEKVINKSEVNIKKILAMYLNKYIDCNISYSPEDYDIEILTHRLIKEIKKEK